MSIHRAAYFITALLLMSSCVACRSTSCGTESVTAWELVPEGAQVGGKEFLVLLPDSPRGPVLLGVFVPPAGAGEIETYAGGADLVDGSFAADVLQKGLAGGYPSTLSGSIRTGELRVSRDDGDFVYRLQPIRPKNPQKGE